MIIEQVDKFMYLGTWITSDGRSETEVKSRIAVANEAFNKRDELMTKSLNITLKKLVCLVALYGAET